MHKRISTYAILFAMIVSFSLLITALFPVIALAGWGQTGTTDGWGWMILDDSTLSITGCTGKSGMVTIPDSLDTVDAGPGVLPVTAIGDDAFNGDYAAITGIVLPGGLKTIGSGAFLGTGISSITIPAGCVSIGGSAFNNTGLSSIMFASPSSLQSIGGNAFAGTGLASVAIPDSVVSIGDYAFAECPHLESVTLPHNAGFTTLRGAVFSSCEALHSIDIPSSVTAINDFAFMASGLQSVTIPTSVTSIGNGVFGGDSNLSGISVAPGNMYFTSQDGVLYNIDKTSLLGFPGGKSGAFTIPEGVTRITTDSFCNSYSLNEVTIPSSVEAIDDYAFIYCSNLSKVFIKSRNANFSDQNIFSGTALATAPDGGIYGISGSTAQTYATANSIPFYAAYYVVTFDSGHGSDVPEAVVTADEPIAAPTAPTFDGYDFGGWYTDSSYATAWDFANEPVTGDMTLYAKWTKDGEIYHSGETDGFTWEAIGDKLTVTGYTGTADGAFVIPDSIDTGLAGLGTMDVTRIGDDAFSYYFTVTSFTLPSNLKSIGKSAFAGCWALESVSIPAGVEDIGDYAFNGCSDMESVSIPASVENIGDCAFQSCSILKNVTIAETSSLKTIGANAFYRSGILSFDMPDSVTSVGDRAFYYCNGLQSVTLSEGLSEISSEMFRSCNSLESITIPASVKSIGSYAFKSSGLTDVTIPDTVLEIGESAFESCEDLQSAVLPDNTSFTKIPDNLFFGCPALDSVNYPAHVTAIGNSVFYNTGFTEIVIPDTVTEIGEGTFEGCENLQSATLPDNTGFTEISDRLFYDCVSLDSVNYPAHVTAIGDYAFCGTAFTGIVIPDTVTSIGSGAFEYCANLKSIALPDNADFTRIPDSLVLGCGALQGIDIPSHVTAIGISAFSSSGLTNLTIPAQTTTIGGWAFAFTPLTTVTIPANVTSMGECVFAVCTSLSSIDVDPANTYFSSLNGVLYNADKTILLACPGAKTGAIIIPDGVKTIKKLAFCGCIHLTAVTIPQSVTEINDEAFEYCELLTKAVIKSDDAVFGDYVFEGTALASDGIYGIDGSTAQTFAEENSFPFHAAFCTVSFDSRHGSLVPDIVAGIDEKIAKPKDPVRTGYQFGGWYKDKDCTQAWDFDADTVSVNKTLYAKWTAKSYAITYNLNDGTNDTSNPSSYTYGTGLTLEAPTRPEYIFGGWFSEAAFLHKVTSISDTLTGDVTLWANWLPVTVTNGDGNVTLDLSGVTFPDGVTGISMSGSTVPPSGEGSGYYAAVLGQTGGDPNSIVIYDLKLLDQNGSPITGFTGKIKVKIKIPDGCSGDLHVYWYDPETGTLTDMDAAVENGYLVFKTSHFSLYAIAQLGSDESTAPLNPGIAGLPDSYTMYTGGRVTWTPGIAGGKWYFDNNYFSAAGDTPTFTALRSGTTSITYTAGWASKTISVTIKESLLPQTGQDSMWIWIFAGAACALAAAGFIGRKKHAK